MWRTVEYDPRIKREYKLKNTMELIVEFRDQIKFESYVENYECDKSKLSDYDLQQFRCRLQKEIKTMI